jgi:hypothetical protein
MLAEIENFLERFNQPTYRGMRVNGENGCRSGRASRAGVGCKWTERTSMSMQLKLLRTSERRSKAVFQCGALRCSLQSAMS